MTVPMAPEAVEAATRRAQANIAAGRWLRPEMQEAHFDDRLHLRGRHGRFRDMPDRPDHAGYQLRAPMRERLQKAVDGHQRVSVESLYGESYSGTALSFDAKSITLNDDFGGETAIPFVDVESLKIVAPHDPTATDWQKMRPAKFDDDVMKVTDAEQATAFLKGLGLTESDLSGEAEWPASTSLKPDWYRQVCQCSKDALARFPILRSGRPPMVGVRIAHSDDVVMTVDDALRSGNVWAFTGPDPRAYTPYVSQDYDQQFIAITPSDMVSQEWDVSDFAAPAGSTIYGRLMHEYGHAVSYAGGHDPHGRQLTADDSLFGGVDRADLTAAKWGPRRLGTALSRYAASAPVEAWAEVFTTLNTPHGMDSLSDKDKRSLLALRDRVNKRGVKLL